MQEPLSELYSNSRLLVLNFLEIPLDTPEDENIKLYFEKLRSQSQDPTSPENRQQFNDYVLDKTGKRYLISRYAEDRSAMLQGSSIAREGRTYHLGIDIFSKELETVYSPCAGEIMTIGQEPEAHSFGYYIIIKPQLNNVPFIFLGHLAKPNLLARSVNAGQAIARLGDYVEHENGGWSRHLHLQMLRELPEGGKAPPGYSTRHDLETTLKQYPDPAIFFKKLKPLVGV